MIQSNFAENSIKMADMDNIRLYGYRPKFVSAGLDRDVSCTPTLSVTTAPEAAYAACYAI